MSNNLISSSSLAQGSHFSESQVKKRVKKWNVPYTCVNGSYIFQKADWEAQLVFNLRTASENKTQRTTKKREKEKASKKKTKTS